jgi:hypothetical protein
VWQAELRVRPPV